MSTDPNLEDLARQQKQQQQQQQQQQPPVVDARVHFNPTPIIAESPSLQSQPSTSGGGGGVSGRSSSKRPLSPPGSDALVLLPEVQQTGRPAGSRRPFQRRRRSRACDACRARKTKCDTPDEGPCSACAAASLICKFSEGGEDRRRAGPARRIRTLEAQVQDLTKKLQEAEALLSGQGSASAVAQQRLGHRRSPSSSPHFSCSSSTAGSVIGSGLHLEPNADVHHAQGDWWRHSHPDTGVPTGEHFRGGLPFGPPGQNQLPMNAVPTAGPTRSASWSRNLFDSNPPFIASYKSYLRTLGYPLSSLEHTSQQAPHGSQPAPRVPLLSEYPSITSNALPMDLRVLMPPKNVAERLCEVFKRNIQSYLPLFYWPVFLEEKFDLAWSRPMWEEDIAVVKGVFCIVQMVLAVASQMVPEEEIKELSFEETEADESQERSTHLEQEARGLGANSDLRTVSGWRFFHQARRYADLNSPTYTADDAMYLLLMSIYLDNACLPSPCWMITTATARVCQDVALDRIPPPNMFSEIELESRRRLFWAAYIQERTACLKKARVSTIQDSDIEISLPKVLEDEDRRSSRPLVSPGGTEGQVSVATEGTGNVLNAEQSLQVMIAQIHISMLCGQLIHMRITDNGGIQDLQHLQELDEKLKKAWDRFPSHMTDLTNLEPLDIGALRPLFFLQYCRLLLYRYFTDTSEPGLNPDFRSFCLAQSLQVSKITAHLIFRTSRNENFDKLFGLRTEELVTLQTFRAAVILLLGHCAHEPALLMVSKDEIEVCARALRSIASYHGLGRKLLEVFQGFARTFGYEGNAAPPQPPPCPPPSENTTPVEVKQEMPTPTRSARQHDVEFPHWEFTGPNYSHTNTPPAHAQHGGQNMFGAHYVPPADWTDPMHFPSFSDMSGVVPPPPIHRERADSIGDLRVDWEAVQQALQFGDAGSTGTGNVSAAASGPGPAPGNAGFWNF